MDFITEWIFFFPDAIVIGDSDGIGRLFGIGDNGPIEMLGDDVSRLFFGEVGLVEGQDVGLLGEFVGCLA